MRKIQTSLLAGTGLVIGLVVGAAVNSDPARAQQSQGSAPVTIVGPLPVPVTGNTSVTGEVSAVQSGAWNVGITGVASIRNIDERGRSPYASATIFGTTTMSCFTTGGDSRTASCGGLRRCRQASAS